MLQRQGGAHWAPWQLQQVRPLPDGQLGLAEHSVPGCASQSCPLSLAQLHLCGPAHSQHLRQLMGLQLKQPPAALRQGQTHNNVVLTHFHSAVSDLRASQLHTLVPKELQCSNMGQDLVHWRCTDGSSLQLAAGSRACSAGSLPTHRMFAAYAGAHSDAGFPALLRLLLLVSVQLLVHQHKCTHGSGPAFHIGEDVLCSSIATQHMCGSHLTVAGFFPAIRLLLLVRVQLLMHSQGHQRQINGYLVQQCPKSSVCAAPTWPSQRAHSVASCMSCWICC